MDEDRIPALERIAERIHDGQVDKQGAPYFEHLRRVAAAVSAPAKPVALFHDAIEDERIAPDELRVLLTADEYAAVLAVTRDVDRESYAEFIERIATCPGLAGELAREVKVADVQDNLGRLTPALERLRARYTAALERLSAHPAGTSPAAAPHAVAGEERDRLRHEAQTGAIDEDGDLVWFVSPSELMKRRAPEAEGERADAKQPPEPD